MKRSAPSKFVQLNSRPSKRVYDPEAVRVIHGQIEELVYPVVEENYDGFFVGTVGGCKVVGNIPFIAENLEMLVIGIILVSLIPAVWHTVRERLARRRKAAAEV